jgi:hypothetical protein
MHNSILVNSDRQLYTSVPSSLRTLYCKNEIRPAHKLMWEIRVILLRDRGSYMSRVAQLV